MRLKVFFGSHILQFRKLPSWLLCHVPHGHRVPSPLDLRSLLRQKLPLLIVSIFQMWHQLQSLGPWASLPTSASMAGCMPGTLMLHWSLFRKWPPRSLHTLRSRQDLCEGQDWSLSPFSILARRLWWDFTWNITQMIQTFKSAALRDLAN